MTALTKELREAAITKALAAHFKAREAALETARTVVADLLFDHAFAAGEKLARKLPSGWIVGRDTIVIESPGFRGIYSRGDEKGPSPHLKLSRERLFPDRITTEFKIDAQHPHHAKVQAIVREHNAILTEKEDLRGKLRTILYSCNTLKQLEERWPEGMRFLPVMPSTSRAMVPVTVIADVNQKLGLTKRTPAKEKSHVR